MKSIYFILGLLFISATIQAQNRSATSTFWHPNPRNCEVKHAIEFESLVPMFLRLWKKY